MHNQHTRSLSTSSHDWAYESCVIDGLTEHVLPGDTRSSRLYILSATIEHTSHASWTASPSMSSQAAIHDRVNCLHVLSAIIKQTSYESSTAFLRTYISSLIGIHSRPRRRSTPHPLRSGWACIINPSIITTTLGDVAVFRGTSCPFKSCEWCRANKCLHYLHACNQILLFQTSFTFSTKTSSVQILSMVQCNS